MTLQPRNLAVLRALSQGYDNISGLYKDESLNMSRRALAFRMRKFVAFGLVVKSKRGFFRLTQLGMDELEKVP